jgi:sigma-B regulation protein RsbU (phosphoserine phosphatase)
MGYDLYGTSIPCRLVGGDYYDFIELPDGNLLIAIADVSGKGMPAAMLMANVQAALRVLSPLGLPLRELITRINEVVYHNTAADKFVTFFSGILDPVTGLFKYINAGHNPPVLLKMNGDMSCLTEGGIILGIADNMYHYTEGSVMLNEGDVLLLYTDGVTDAMNKDDHDFGEIRLQSELIDNKNSTSDMIIDAILKSIWNYMENTPQFDDLTMVVLKRTIN